jgi:hypothetical protein
VPMGRIFDLALLSQLVPVQLRAPGCAQPDRKPAQVVRGIDSSRVLQLYPCPAVPTIRRAVDSFWFSQCSRGVNSEMLLGRIQQLLGAPPGAPTPVNVLLRSGLFYSEAIKVPPLVLRFGSAFPPLLTLTPYALVPTLC